MSDLVDGLQSFGFLRNNEVWPSVYLGLHIQYFKQQIDRECHTKFGFGLVRHFFVVQIVLGLSGLIGAIQDRL
jgi:hypothetical protein